MKLVIKTGEHPSRDCIIDLDGKPLGEHKLFVSALDIRLRPDGTKIVVDVIDISSGEKEYSTRTFYVTGPSTLGLEIDEVNEASSTSEDA